MGVHISKVKHLKLDRWEDSQVKRMKEVGNLNAKLKYEERVPPCYRKPAENDPQTRRTSYDMAVQLSEDQCRELMRTAQPQHRNRHFTQCTARFDGTRTQAAVTEFLTAIKIFKSVERITDADALTGLPLLLTGEASTWWNGIKGTIATFSDATQAIQLAFAPQRPNFRVFSEIFACTQTAEMTTDQFVTSQRDRFSQLSEDLPEKWQIDMVYALLRSKIRDRVPRDDVTTFQDLLKKARVIEAAERDHKGLKPAKPAAEPARARVKCDFCKNFGHPVSECRKKARTQAPTEEAAPRPSTSTPTNPIQCYGCGTPGVIRRNCPRCSKAPVPVSFCYVDTQSMERPAVEITIHGIRGTAYLDSGAKATLASPELYRILAQFGHSFAEKTINLVQADGKSRITTVRSTTVPVLLKGRTIKTTFLALPDTPNAKTLLGVDFLHDAGLVVDYKHAQWHFHGNRHQCYGFLPKDQQPLHPEEMQKPKRSRGQSPSLTVPIAGLLHEQQPPSGPTEPEPMQCDHESQLIEGYGPTYPAPHAEDIRHAAQVLQPLDSQVLIEQWIRAKYQREEFCHPEKQTYINGYKDGYLKKRGKEDSAYHPRKFVLSESDDTLKYFVKEKDKEPKAILRVSELNVVFAPEKVAIPTSLQLTFLKDGSTRHIYVYHDNPEEITNWYMAIRCVKLHRLQVAYPSASEADLVNYLTEDFAKEGWLFKTGPRSTDGFKKRWFTLDNRKLMYHDDPLDAHPKGEIFLGYMSDGYSVRVGAKAGVKDLRFTFTLTTPERVFNLSAMSEVERDQWIAVIERVLERPLTPQDSVISARLVRKRTNTKSINIFSAR
ncbi:arf-gap with dual ph domain-containing protein 1-like protein [Holotrichia oblita]|uniref:Arf-gap with dual ph domain-containing protein 1-like protein n=1 Tax=Holotrichia oblita TaxID=644536 RepID=A0ACB9TWM4_HOLOL|nr:arf-gap with dual ph domain-containing protein 1-like protein [Holotrichia oblita]